MSVNTVSPQRLSGTRPRGRVPCGQGQAELQHQQHSALPALHSSITSEVIKSGEVSQTVITKSFSQTWSLHEGKNITEQLLTKPARSSEMYPIIPVFTRSVKQTHALRMAVFSCSYVIRYTVSSLLWNKNLLLAFWKISLQHGWAGRERKWLSRSPLTHMVPSLQSLQMSGTTPHTAPYSSSMARTGKNQIPRLGMRAA